MSSELYFIPLIDRALRQADARAALAQAFSEIIALGEQRDYYDGFLQFQRFVEMAIGQFGHESLVPLEQAVGRELIVDLAYLSFYGEIARHGAALEWVRAHPQVFGEYEQLLAEVGESQETRPAMIISLFSGDLVVAQVSVTDRHLRAAADGVVPGDYRLVSDTGRLFWERTLTERELLWASAFPGRPLALAADSERTPQAASLEESLMGGELVVRVLPGIEAGRIELLVAPGGPDHGA